MNPVASMPMTVAGNGDSSGYDLVIAPEEIAPANTMVLASCPAEVDTRNTSIVTSILDVLKKAAAARQTPSTPAPKLPKVKPAKSKSKSKPLPKTKTKEPLNEGTWDELVAATEVAPPVELPEGANPKVVDDETRDDFDLPRHTKVKRNKGTGSSITSLDDKALSTLLNADDNFDIDDFVNSID